MRPRLSTTSKIGIMTLALWLSAMPLMAATDYGSMTNEELSGLRGTMWNASREEHAAFRSAWQSRLNDMSVQERQKYAGPPEAAGQVRTDSQDQSGAAGGCRCGRGRRCR